MSDRNQKKPKQKKKHGTEDKDRIDSLVDAGSSFTQNGH
jgi:hypothetical protein